MKSLTANLCVAIIWMLLHGEPSLVVFLVGWAVGFALLALFSPVLRSGAYVRRTLGLGRFLAVFGRAFVTSSWQLLMLVLMRRVRDLHPRLITYDVRGLTMLEILLLSHSISLTPGTTTVDVSPDRNHLVLHVLDAPEPETVRRDIDQTLRSAILGFTR